MKIIAARRKSDIDVEFLDDFHFIKKNVSYQNFKRGQVKNPYDKTMLGIGYLGFGKYRTWENNDHTVAYMTWKCMLERCYHEKRKLDHPSYYDICTVCNEWFNYQNFAKWFEENFYYVDERLHLDKDIKNPNCKIYSPDTCLLVPQRINMLFLNMPNKHGLPNGIRMTDTGRYSASYNNNSLGIYDTIEEAYALYANKKEETIKQVANEYINIIPKVVYDALYSYKVDIKNDKNYKVAWNLRKREFQTKGE